MCDERLKTGCTEKWCSKSHGGRLRSAEEKDGEENKDVHRFSHVKHAHGSYVKHAHRSHVKHTHKSHVKHTHRSHVKHTHRSHVKHAHGSYVKHAHRTTPQISGHDAVQQTWLEQADHTLFPLRRSVWLYFTHD